MTGEDAYWAGLGPDDFYDDDGDPIEENVRPCSVCSCLIGDEVAYGDTWDGRWVCAGCAGVSEENAPEEAG